MEYRRSDSWGWGGERRCVGCGFMAPLLVCMMLTFPLPVSRHSENRWERPPILERHVSDFGPRRSDTWESFGGRRRERPSDIGSVTSEDWSKPLAKNERLER